MKVGSSETIRQARFINLWIMEDIVRPAWRHAEHDRNIMSRKKYVVTFERNSLAGKFCPARMASRLENCLHEGSGEIAMSVKMPPPCGKTKRPREASLQLGIGTSSILLSIGGRL